MFHASASKLALPIVLLVACAHSNSQGDKVRDARLEQVDAQTRSELNAIDERGRTSGEALARQYDSQGQAVDNGSKAAEEATEQIVLVSKERAQYQHDAEVRAAKLGVRLEAARKKIDVLGAHAPSDLGSDLGTLTALHRDVSQDVSRLSGVTPDNWGAMQSSLDERMRELDTRLTQLHERINKV